MKLMRSRWLSAQDSNLIPVAEISMVSTDPNANRICIFIMADDPDVQKSLALCGRDTRNTGKRGYFGYIAGMGLTADDLQRAAFCKIGEMRGRYHPYIFMCPECHSRLNKVSKEIRRIYEF